MSAQYENIKKQAQSLPTKQKAALARVLIEELDPVSDPEAEQLWIEEAQRRYDAYLKGEIEQIPGDEAMRKARERLK